MEHTFVDQLDMQVYQIEANGGSNLNHSQVERLAYYYAHEFEQHPTKTPLGTAKQFSFPVILPDREDTAFLGQLQLKTGAAVAMNQDTTTGVWAVSMTAP